MRRLGAWGREVAGSDAGSAELQRDLEVIDDVVEEAFRAYREREGRGEDAGVLVRAIEALVGSSVEVREARRKAEAREADPEREADVSEFPERRRSDEPKERRAEAG